MKTKTISTILALLMNLTLSAQSELNEIMYQAYLQRSQPLWGKALALQQKESSTKNNSVEAQMKLAYTYFSMLNGTLATQNETLFDQHVGEAKKLLKKIMDKYPASGEAKAMLSSIYGNEIAYSSMKGMLLGGKSSSLAEKGKEQEPSSPLTWCVYASNKFYTPTAFGGSLKESILAFEKAILLFEEKPAQLVFNWLYLDALAVLGKAYQKEGETKKAIATYEKALSVEPNFGWVKHVLLPAAKKTNAAN